MTKAALLGLISGLMAFLSASLAPAQDAEATRHVLHELGGPFIVYRANVQAELTLSDTEKQKLRERLPSTIQETAPALERLDSLEGDEREQAMQPLREASGRTLWAFLKQTLTAQQFERLRQLELQHEGPAALVGRPDVVNALQITAGERQQIIAIIQDMQRQIEPLIREAQSRGNPKDILPKVIQIRADYDGKIESVLSDAQKKQWAAMRGKRFDVFNDN